MVMRPDVLDAAICASRPDGSPLIYLTPRGRLLDQARVRELAAGVAGVPASGASAVAMNVTMTRSFDDGFVTVYPAGRSRPDASRAFPLLG